jgi:ABC-type nitrate/sulfonate/bicarbonate transport system substrate-binding protein
LEVEIEEMIESLGSRVAISRSRVLGLLGSVPLTALSLSTALAQAPALRIGTVLAESYAEPVYSRDGGFLTKAGINADISLFSTGGQITNALVGGALDVGIADVLQVALAISHGIPLIFFAGATVYTSTSPTTVLAVAKDALFKSAKDFEGQTIGLPGLRSMPECSVREWLTVNGADQSKVHIVEVPPSAIAVAIARGTIAAGALPEPYVTGAGDTIRVIGKPYDMCAKLFMQNAWFTTRDWLANNDQVAHKLVKATYETAAWANEHRDLTTPILEKMTKVDVKTVHAMTRATFATHLDPKLMQPVLDIALKYKILDRQINASDIIAKTIA